MTQHTGRVITDVDTAPTPSKAHRAFEILSTGGTSLIVGPSRKKVEPKKTVRTLAHEDERDAWWAGVFTAIVFSAGSEALFGAVSGNWVAAQIMVASCWTGWLGIYRNHPGRPWAKPAPTAGRPCTIEGCTDPRCVPSESFDHYSDAPLWFRKMYDTGHFHDKPANLKCTFRECRDPRCANARLRAKGVDGTTHSCGTPWQIASDYDG